MTTTIWIPAPPPETLQADIAAITPERRSVALAPENGRVRIMLDAPAADWPAIRAWLQGRFGAAWNAELRWTLAEIAGGKESGIIVWSDGTALRCNWANNVHEAAVPRLFAGAIVWTPTTWADMAPGFEADRALGLMLLHREEQRDGVAPEDMSRFGDARAVRLVTTTGEQILVIFSQRWI